MFSLRPHKIQVVTIGEVTADSVGNVVSGNESLSAEYPCRVESNSRSTYTDSDGRTYTYSYDVYCDSDFPMLDCGKVVRITFNGITLDKAVLGISKDRLHTRIWL